MSRFCGGIRHLVMMVLLTGGLGFGHSAAGQEGQLPSLEEVGALAAVLTELSRDATF